MSEHTHTAERDYTEPYTGAVSRIENRRAHGGHCYVEVCACGAVRRTNVNRRHTEEGPWVMAPKVSSGDLLDQGEVAELLGVQASSLRAMLAQPERHRRLDGMPEPIRRVGNAPVWDRRQVEAWLARSGR